jgi:hypothetical protein
VAMRSLTAIAALAGAFALGCAACAPSAPKVEQMRAEPSVHQVSAQANGAFAKRSLLVGEVTGETSERGVEQSLRDALWHSMTESLENSRVFRAVVTNGSADYRLDGDIVSHQELLYALTATSSILMVRYRLTDLASGRVVWRETVTSHFDAAGGDLTGANEGAVRDNLTRLVDKLSAFSLAQAGAETSAPRT